MRLLPNPLYLTCTANGRVYRGVAGVVSEDVPYFDAMVLSANGWLPMPPLEDGEAAIGVTQVVAPVEGQIIQLKDNGINGYLLLTGGGVFTTLGLRVPTPSGGRDTMVRRVFCDVDVALIDWGVGVDVNDGPLSMTVGDSCTLTRLEATKWQRAR